VEINVLAVLAAAVSAFALGGLWYSNALFANAWMAAAGLTSGTDGTARARETLNKSQLRR
jgi:hypothetical protein